MTRRLRSMLDELEEVWSEKRPGLHKQLRRGASESRILRFERRFARLPVQLATLYRWHDGLADIHYGVEGFFGWSPLDDVTRSKQGLDALELSGHFTSVGHAPGAWWNVRWIPFLQFNCSDHVCVDVTGTLRAGRGAIFEWRAYEGPRALLAPSLSAWVEAHLAVTREGPPGGGRDEWREHFGSRRAARARKQVTPGYPRRMISS